MSEKKTLVGKAIEWLVDQFKENKYDFFKWLWKKVPSDLKPELNEIIEIVERVKSYVDSPATDLITFAIPGKKDDLAIAFMRNLLGDVISYLSLLDKQPKDLTPTDAHNIATLLAKEKLGISYGQAVVTVENAFQNRN